jgi:hypothetical protein
MQIQREDAQIAAGDVSRQACQAEEDRELCPALMGLLAALDSYRYQ